MSASVNVRWSPDVLWHPICIVSECRRIVAMHTPSKADACAIENVGLSLVSASARKSPVLRGAVVGRITIWLLAGLACGIAVNEHAPLKQRDNSYYI